MRGREVLLDSFALHGVEYIFGNPGTTENPLLDGLVEYPAIQYIMALHEGVAMAAANTYTQASGKSAVVNLHAAPGLGNAAGNLFCAFKAGSPLIVTAGQQDVRLRVREPVLQHDLVAMAAPITKWSVQIERPDEVGPIMRRAFKIAHEAPRGPVFVALPVDVMEGETDIGASKAGMLYPAAAADTRGIAAAAELLLASKSPAIIVGDEVAWAHASETVVALAERTGATMWLEWLRNQSPVPTMHATARGSMPTDMAGMRKALSKTDFVLMIGGRFFEELWFEPGTPFAPGTKVVQIESAPVRLAYNNPLDIGLTGDIAQTAQALLAQVEAHSDSGYRNAAAERLAALGREKAAQMAAVAEQIRAMPTDGAMRSAQALAAIRDALPPRTIIVEESSTTRGDVARILPFSGPGDYFAGRGGGIGQGLPGALGAKVACPDRPVVALSGDGSGMYGVQALWSAAHHKLNIVFLIFANREYRVLKQNIDEYRARFRAPTDRPYPHMDLSEPNLDYVRLAEGMGVAATRVTTPAELTRALGVAFAANAPYLIEMVVA
ncbi:MAG: thiamine pyrophosphate-binding protein [Alphaproteobacteria bacterium]